MTHSILQGNDVQGAEDRSGRASIAISLTIASLFTELVESLTELSGFGFADELIVIVLVVMALFEPRRPSSAAAKAVYAGFVAYLVVLMLSAVFGEYRQAPFWITLIVSMKMPITIWAVARFNWTNLVLKKLLVSITVLAIVSGCAVVLNLILGEAWIQNTTTSTPYIDYRFGMLSAQGLFGHPLIQGTVSAILLIIVGTSFLSVNDVKYRKTAVMLTLFSIGVSFRRTVFASVVLGMYTVVRNKLAIGIVAAWIFLVTIAIKKDEIVEFVKATFFDYSSQGQYSAPRVRMLQDSVTIANENFPFGAGSGNFGSLGAATFYSPYYVDNGYQWIWGLMPTEGAGMYLQDSALTAVIGEAGWIGAIAMVIVLALLLVIATKLTRRGADGYDDWIGRSLIGCVIVVTLSSVTIPLFTGTAVLPLFALVAGIVISRYNASATPTLLTTQN